MECNNCKYKESLKLEEPCATCLLVAMHKAKEKWGDKIDFICTAQDMEEWLNAKQSKAKRKKA